MIAESQTEAKSFIFAWRFVSEVRKNNFDISESQKIDVGNLLSYPSLSSVLIDVESHSQGVEFGASYAIDELYYLEGEVRLAEGKVFVPVGGGDNIYSSGKNSLEVGLGINRIVLPETPVTPAVRVGLYGECAGYNFRRLQTVQPTEQILSIDADFRETTAIAIFSVSRHIGVKRIFEPYGIAEFGMRWISLFDNLNAREVGGQKTLFQVAVGINYCFDSSLGKKFFAEYKFGTTSSWSAGFKFKL